ncbi:MAG: serine hydrolase [Desulfurivibrionaceae bacterium]
MTLEKKIRGLLEENISNNVFPCINVGISYEKNKKKKHHIINAGKKIDQTNKELLNENLFFDLASLTKPFATVLSLLSLINEGKLSINKQLKNIFNDNIPSDKRNISVEQLLSHSAGFPDHRSYYKQLVEVNPVQRAKVLFELLMAEPLLAKPGHAVLYSDLGYMLLGLVIEKVSGLKLDRYFNTMIMAPIGLGEHIFFKPIGSEKNPPGRFAPVEYCPWRGRILRGEVSDDNCWALGGVAGHAGLYGDVKGVLKLSELILDIWQGQGRHPHINRRDLTVFLNRTSGLQGDTWALGFDRPNPAGGASCGKYLSTASVGHLGFTGTSFWIDPERKLVIVILSNRVHPSRANERIKKFRPAFHDRVVEWVEMELKET